MIDGFIKCQVEIGNHFPMDYRLGLGLILSSDYYPNSKTTRLSPMQCSHLRAGGLHCLFCLILLVVAQVEWLILGKNRKETCSCCVENKWVCHMIIYVLWPPALPNVHTPTLIHTDKQAPTHTDKHVYADTHTHPHPHTHAQKQTCTDTNIHTPGSTAYAIKNSLVQS